jgi:hypothetical protein
MLIACSAATGQVIGRLWKSWIEFDPWTRGYYLQESRCQQKDLTRSTSAILQLLLGTLCLFVRKNYLSCRSCLLIQSSKFVLLSSRRSLAIMLLYTTIKLAKDAEEKPGVIIICLDATLSFSLFPPHQVSACNSSEVHMLRSIMAVGQ